MRCLQARTRSEPRLAALRTTRSSHERQTITSRCGERLVVVAETDYLALLKAAEDSADRQTVRDFRSRLAVGDEELVPADVVDRISQAKIEFGCGVGTAACRQAHSPDTPASARVSSPGSRTEYGLVATTRCERSRPRCRSL